MRNSLIDKIINDIVNTTDGYGEIARRYKLTIEEFYRILENYLNENGKRLVSNRDNKIVRREFVDSINNKTKRTPGFHPQEDTIEKLNTIIKWCEEHKRLPKGFKNEYYEINRDELTEEELLELDYYAFLNNFICSNKLNIDHVEEEKEGFKKEVTLAIIDLLSKYSSSKRFKVYRDATELKSWSDKTGYKPRSKIGDRSSEELTEDEKEELRAYNILKMLRGLKDIERLPIRNKEDVVRILKEVERRYRSTDEAFLSKLRQTLENDNIRISPFQTEIIERVVNGESFSCIARETGAAFEQIYSIVDNFCAKYNCSLIKQKRSANGDKRVFAKKGFIEAIEK